MNGGGVHTAEKGAGVLDIGIDEGAIELRDDVKLILSHPALNMEECVWIDVW